MNVCTLQSIFFLNEILWRKSQPSKRALKALIVKLITLSRLFSSLLDVCLTMSLPFSSKGDRWIAWLRIVQVKELNFLHDKLLEAANVQKIFFVNELSLHLGHFLYAKLLANVWSRFDENLPCDGRKWLKFEWFEISK